MSGEHAANVILNILG